MEPGGAVEDGGPVELVGLDQSDGRAVAVIDDGRCALGSTGLKEEETHATRPTNDAIGLDTVTSKFLDRAVTQRPLWQGRHIPGPQPVVRDRDRDVGLSSGERGFKQRGLEEPFVTR